MQFTDENYYHKSFILDNLHKAHEAISLVPEEEVDLRRYKDAPGTLPPTERNPCGALYCAYGELTLVPHFQNLGILLKKSDSLDDVIWYPVEPKDLTQYEIDMNGAYVWLNRYFGPKAWGRLFDARGAGRLDQLLFSLRGNMSDKQLSLARIEKQIEYVSERVTTTNVYDAY